MSNPAEDVTALLLDWEGGDAQALEQLLPLVYGEMHRIASAYFARENAGHTLQPTALVNEVYLKLVDQKRVRWHNRNQFFGVTAQMMRRILVDHARRRRADKRGGNVQRVQLDEASDLPIQDGVDLVALDEALDELASFDVQQAKIVELRFFAGLTVPEAGSVLGISPATVKREWSTARAWLFQRLRQDI